MYVTSLRQRDTRRRYVTDRSDDPSPELKYQMSEGPDPFSDSFDDPISRHGKSVDRTDEIAYRI